MTVKITQDINSQSFINLLLKYVFVDNTSILSFHSNEDHSVVFWVTSMYSLEGVYKVSDQCMASINFNSEAEGIIFLHNTSAHLQVYMMS